MGKHGLSVSLIHPIVHSIVRKGYNLEAFCRYTAFDPSILQDAEARIPEEEMDRLLDAASSFTNDDRFGLRQGQTIEISNLGILGYVLLNCSTIGQALDAYRRYNIILCSGIDMEWGKDDHGTWIRFRVGDPARQASVHAIEGMVSSLYHLLFKLSCRKIPVHLLHFTHDAPANVTVYQNAFGTAPRFGQETNRLYCDREVADYPILLSDARMLRTFEAYAEEARSRLLHGRALSDQVYNWLIHNMPSSFPSVQDTARHFKVSIRALQAKLKQEEASYNILFNKARMELACRYLRNPEFTVAEVAYLLQYSEPSAFQNAFKRWTGLPPGQYRSASVQPQKREQTPKPSAQQDG
ncbi:AraC family transcriptional regulator [Paenibacillus mesophilus]|uniref:AraC family transcriptional regulator n=1 Tax=Paenibacillus mesophilus TaxID=2582849 RepID=UPI0013052DE6|nr:AraC family transcriptional regulator [Paenibacillus mesophilus]